MALVKEDETRKVYRFLSHREIVPYLSELLKRKAAEIKPSSVLKIGVSGGSVISYFSEAVQRIGDVDYSKWRIFFCDERVVPYCSPDSTYGEYKKALTPLGFSDDNFVPIDEGLSAEDAAVSYTKKLTLYFKHGAGDESIPQFDLVLLGMGPDGHTCSLFPGHPSCTESIKDVVIPITDSPKPPPCRITLSLNTVNHSKSAVFLVTGQSKADVLKRIVKDGEKLPAGMIRLTHSAEKVIFLVDEEAGSLL